MSWVWTAMAVTVAVALGLALAAVVARIGPDAPSQAVEHEVPAQIDRADFARSECEWLVAVFSSSTCDACAGVLQRASVLESEHVSVVDVEVSDQPAIHDRYRITAVPTTIVADAQGVVVTSFLGPVSSTHLWAAVAEARQPGSVPQGCTEPLAAQPPVSERLDSEPGTET